MANQVFPQTQEVHLTEKGMSLEFHASLEIYKALLSNPNIVDLGHSPKCLSIGDEMKSNPIMNDAIQLGKQFCSNFKEKED